MRLGPAFANIRTSRFFADSHQALARYFFFGLPKYFTRGRLYPEPRWLRQRCLCLRFCFFRMSQSLVGHYLAPLSSAFPKYESGIPLNISNNHAKFELNKNKHFQSFLKALIIIILGHTKAFGLFRYLVTQMSDRVKNRFPRPLSRENIPPRPSITSIIKRVCFHASYCAPPI